MKNFTLINPVIAGTFGNNYKCNTDDEAAKQFWEALTTEGKLISGNMPQFFFTLMNTKNKELSHYKVNEIPSNSYTDYSIDKVNLKLSSSEEQSLIKDSKSARNKTEQISNNKTGGRKKRYSDYDDDDSSSSSDEDLDDFFKYVRSHRVQRPIVYWWYTPSVYKTNSIFSPTFVAPVSPYVQLWIPT